MKSIVFLIGLLCIAAVSAAEVCIVVQMEDDKAEGDCLNVAEGTSGFELLEQSDLDFTWSDEGAFGRALCKIEGKGDNVIGTSCAWGSNYWGFYIINDGEWAYMPVGFSGGNCWNKDLESFSGHYCAEDDDVIGFRYGEFGTLPDMLRVEEVKIYVDGDKSSADEDGGKIKDVEPESEIEIKVEVENLYPDDVDIEIEDVSAEIIIEGIDDGDDIEEESDESGIDADDKEELVITFDIPLEVEEDDYSAKLIITAEDEKGVEYEKIIEYELEVEKDRHDIMFEKIELYPETVACRGGSTLDVTLINLGTENEDVELTISNPDLGIDIRDNFELDEDPFDDDSKYRRKFNLIVDASEGLYPILATADYGDGEESASVNLNIAACVSEQEEEAEDEEDEEEELIPIYVPIDEQYSDPGFWDEYGTATVIGAIAFVVILSFIIVAVTMLR